MVLGTSVLREVITSMKNSDTGKTVVVPVHGNKDLPKGTYFAILKQAGIEK